jgi:hypothetical protein
MLHRNLNRLLFSRLGGYGMEEGFLSESMYKREDVSGLMLVNQILLFELRSGALSF